MMTAIRSGIIIGTLLLLSSWNLTAQEATVGNDFGIGARALGMGGAFIAVADDFTATRWNPAGLSQIRNIEFSGALSNEQLEAEMTYFRTLSSSKISNTRLNSIGAVFPVPTYQGGLAFALGLNRAQSFDSRISLKGFDPEFYDETFGDLRSQVKETSMDSGSIYSWVASGAIDLSPDFSIGASISFLSGSRSYELDLTGEDIENSHPEVDTLVYDDLVEREYEGFAAKLGGLFKVGKHIRLGATIDFPKTVIVYEDWIMGGEDFYDDGTSEWYEETGYFPYEIYLPFEFGGGIAILLPRTILAADVQYVDWTQTRYSESPSEDMNNDDFIEKYRPTLRLRVGGELSIPALNVKARAGFLSDPLPYKPEHIEIETDRYFLTLGLGITVERILALDVAYLHGLWEQSSDILEEDWSTDRVFFSATYRF